MADAVVHLHRLGHRRIGFINGAASYTYSHLRHAGYHAGLDRAGLQHDPALEIDGARLPEEGERAAHALLSRPKPPTAIVCAIDAAALGVYRTARSLGLTIGQDLSLISYDGAPEGAFVDPPLSTYRVDVRTAGERLAHLLIDLVRGAAPERLREYARATFLDRGSAAAPSRSFRRPSGVDNRRRTTPREDPRPMTIQGKRLVGTALALLLTAVPTLAEELRFWTTEEQPERLARQEAMAADFAAATGHSVEVIPITESDLGTRATAAFAAGDLPDVIYHPLQYALPWAEAGILDTDAATDVIEELGAGTFAAGPLAMAAVEGGTGLRSGRWLDADGGLQEGPLRCRGARSADFLRQRDGRARGAPQPAGDVRLRRPDEDRRELHEPGSGTCLPRQRCLAGQCRWVPGTRQGRDHRSTRVLQGHRRSLAPG